MDSLIFVTVGTHEQQFNRLVQSVDMAVGNELLTNNVVMQTGYSTFLPKHCEWSKFFSYADMNSLMQRAEVVVTHGGPSSFIEAMLHGKVPVVVPRQKKYGEHVNDHQLTFVKTFDAEHEGRIIPVYDINELIPAIEKASISSAISAVTNNERFCTALAKLLKQV